MNKKNLIILGVIGGVLLLIAMIFGGYYNSFVKKTQAVDGQWAQVETQYQRRVDLIPNLVSTARGFLSQEQTVFADVTASRAAYVGAKTTDEKVAAANQVEGGLSRLLAVVEAYPQLKSNETMLALMAELSGTENRVSVERKRFNDEVKTYNTSVKTFPGNLFAGLFGFSEKKFFEAAPGSEVVPTVNFN